MAGRKPWRLKWSLLADVLILLEAAQCFWTQSNMPSLEFGLYPHIDDVIGPANPVPPPAFDFSVSTSRTLSVGYVDL